MLFGFLLFIFIIVCIVLTLLILIQSDKGGGISGAIGGGLGGASSLLGTQDTANILTRGTAIFSGAFLLLCILMSASVSHNAIDIQKSLLQKRAEKQQSFSPASVLQGSGLPMAQGQNGAAATGNAAAGAQQPSGMPPQAGTPAQANDQNTGAVSGKTIPMAPPGQQPEK